MADRSHKATDDRLTPGFGANTGGLGLRAYLSAIRIYLFSRLQIYLKRGESVEAGLRHTFNLTGSAVVFTGLTLAVGVRTWIFSALKFQADMGILLTFMFLLNMLGAMTLLPALARWFFKN